ncbi:MAG TPA: ABC transporter permease [Woeseiaceae bacterium]|nr:ABC transporter permease [Woeseiaceae bacterium]
MKTLAILGKLAWRNLWRNRRRTFIMLAAVAIGIWAMIFMTALTQGMVNEMVKDGVSALPGYVQVHQPDYLDDPNINNLIPTPDSEIAARFGSAGLVQWASRIKVPAVLSSERETRGVTLLGIDPGQEHGMTFIHEDNIDGRFLADAADDGIVIGRNLAKTLDTGVGKRVVIMSQDLANNIADRGFRVIGLFGADMQSYEDTYVFVGKSTLQRLLDVGDRVTEIAVMGDDYRNVGPLVDKVKALTGDNVVVQPWTELDPYLGTMLKVMDGFVLVWVIVIFLALSFGLVNTLVMAVFERVREIGLMLALGMKPMSILGQILIESMLLLLFGMLIGNGLAWLSINPLQAGIDISFVGQGMEMFGASSVLIPQLRLQDVLLANGVVLLLGFLASLSPAWRASRYQPIEAITKVD